MSNNIDLTQTDLNEQLRGMTNVDILMFLPDKNVIFPNNAVTVNGQTLQYTTNLQSMITFSSLPQANLATFENNSWILDGSFISPSAAYGGGGDSYTGYISNDYTDNNGNYSTNPVLTVTLAYEVPIITYLSLKFAGGIDTSYPKTFKIRTYDISNTLIQEHTINMSTQTGLPLLVTQINDTNVKKLDFEFVGTQCPHRRSRLDKILFGKAEKIDNNYLQSWKIDDKASLVADSIPTKTLQYTIINYNRDYDIDNLNNKIPNNFKDVSILFTLSVEKNGLWKYAPTKVFNLIDISTTPEGLVTFNCGSLLDILTETYDQDVYLGPKTIGQVMNNLFAFSNISTDKYVLNDYANYEINIPLPELPVREIIQRLAFSCGATLVIDDDNKIIFTQKNIRDTTYASKFMYHLPEPFNSAGILLQEPNAEALPNTTNIAMYTYDTTASAETSELGTTDVSTIKNVKITFSPAVGAIQIDQAYLTEQHASLGNQGNSYSQHVDVQINWDDAQATLPIKVRILGIKAETTQNTPKTADKDTLLLDSGLSYKTSSNDLIMNNLKPESSSTRNPNIFYYSDWYGAKFKYICKTRNEYLVKAGDIILFETPFSNKEANKVGYVLRNSYSNNQASGEMEVVVVG